jgi:hypothetical protein
MLRKLKEGEAKLIEEEMEEEEGEGEGEKEEEWKEEEEEEEEEGEKKDMNNNMYEDIEKSKRRDSDDLTYSITIKRNSVGKFEEQFRKVYSPLDSPPREKKSEGEDEEVVNHKLTMSFSSPVMSPLKAKFFCKEDLINDDNSNCPSG